MRDALSAARFRAQRYWYRDGVLELIVGIVFLLQGGWILINHLINSKSSWYLPIVLIYLLLIAAFSVSVARMRNVVRERYTYPRSGYVGDDESARKRRIRIGVVLAIVAAAVGLVAFRHTAGGRLLNQWILLLPTAGGLTVGAASIYVSVRQGLPRFLILGAISIILGVSVSFEYPLKLAMAIWEAGVGCAWICSGAVTFWRYVQTAPSSGEAT